MYTEDLVIQWARAQLASSPESGDEVGHTKSKNGGMRNGNEETEKWETETKKQGNNHE